MSSDMDDFFDNFERDSHRQKNSQDDDEKKLIDLDPTLDKDELEGDKAFDGPMPGDKWLDS